MRPTRNNFKMPHDDAADAIWAFLMRWHLR